MVESTWFVWEDLGSSPKYAICVLFNLVFSFDMFGRDKRGEIPRFINVIMKYDLVELVVHWISIVW